MPRFTRLLGLAGLGLVAVSTPALAHAHLKAATPAAGSTVATAPAELDLVFSEALTLKFSGVQVTGPGKSAVSLGAATLAPGEGTTLVVPVSGPLAPGDYTVAWHALATDGHKTTGTYTFTLRP